MGGITLISSTVVKAIGINEIEQLSIKKIELTPWDLQLLLVDPIQKGLLFHKPKSFSHHNIQHLKTSLSRTLDFFPPLSGRLTTIIHHDNTTSFFVNCNNAGALFVHSRADSVTISDINDSFYEPREIVNLFFPLNGVKNYQGTSEPLLAVQVTELVDGVFIGCTVNHTVADGTSFWHFFNSWSEISRGFDCVSRPPVLKRWFLDETNVPIHITFPNNHNKLHFDEIIGEKPSLKERVFHFSKEKIAQLKSRANDEINGNKISISSLQAVLAHLWRSVIRGSVDINLDVEESCYRLLIGATACVRETR